MYEETYAVEASTQYGSIRVDPHMYFLSQYGTPTTVSITGEVYAQERKKVIVTVERPNSATFEMQTMSTKDGIFETPMPLPYGALEGTYYVSASVDGKRLGQVDFRVLKSSSDPTASAPQPPPQPSSQQNNARMMVTTDKGTYNMGDRISISGSGQPDSHIGLRISAPNGNVVFVGQVMTNQNGQYVATVPIEGNMWSKTGTYTARVGYANQIAETNFLLQTLSRPQSTSTTSGSMPPSATGTTQPTTPTTTQPGIPTPVVAPISPPTTTPPGTSPPTVTPISPPTTTPPGTSPPTAFPSPQQPILSTELLIVIILIASVAIPVIIVARRRMKSSTSSVGVSQRVLTSRRTPTTSYGSGADPSIVFYRACPQCNHAGLRFKKDGSQYCPRVDCRWNR